MSRFAHVNIESRDGVSIGTKVTDAETGAEIPGIEEVEIVIRPDDAIRARLTIGLAKVKMQAGATYFVRDPRSGAQKRVAKIVYHDGQIFEPGAE